jgi:hypothetical protein
MRSGLLMEFYYGRPSRVLTPWGRMHLWRDGRHSGGNPMLAYRVLLASLGATLEIPEFQNRMGCFGPWYALRSVEGRPLPPAVRPDDVPFVSHEDYQRAKALWGRLRASRPDAQTLGE